MIVDGVHSDDRVHLSRRRRQANRGISGISMGGYGALKIAMKHPEMFGSVSSHSAALIPDLASASNNVSARTTRYVHRAVRPNLRHLRRTLLTGMRTIR